MPIDIAVLATTIVSTVLVPLAKKGAEKLAEGMGEKLGESSAQQVTGVMSKIWARVKSVFTSDDDKSALAQLEKRPEAAKSLVEEILKEKLAQDPGLAQELSDLLSSAGPGGQSFGAIITGAEIAGIADARGANFAGASGVNISGVNLGEKPKTAKE
ncbi:MAG: hypothetical protein EOM24_07740 [Chloroflexia bacterium]|nr:hypothetical protein [Chloroflexia bacterium]